MVAYLGSAGIGAVWGWLVGAAHRRGRLSESLTATGATLLLVVEASALAGWRASAWLTAAALTCLVVHLALRRALRRRVAAAPRGAA
jgi:hypothetical protein